MKANGKSVHSSSTTTITAPRNTSPDILIERMTNFRTRKYLYLLCCAQPSVNGRGYTHGQAHVGSEL